MQYTIRGAVMIETNRNYKQQAMISKELSIVKDSQR